MSRSKRGAPGDYLMIDRIVDRCHVAWSNRSVIKYIISRLANGYSTWRELARVKRRNFMRHAIRRHAHNRGIYNFVMRGV